MVGPIVQVVYMRCCAENEGSSSDSVLKYPAVMMTMSRCGMWFDSKKWVRSLPTCGDSRSTLGMYVMLLAIMS